MKLVLGPSSLTTTLDFTIFQNIGNIKLTAGRIGHFDKIGLCFSGGLDSTALLCLILSELKRIDLLDVIPVTCFTVLKNDGVTYYADRILRKVEERFECDIEHINNIENPFVNILPSLFNDGVMLNIVNMKKNMIFYTALNLPPVTLVSFNHSSPAAFDENFSKKHHIVAPFRNMHKPQILDILYKLNCEDLIQFTHSCVMQPTGKCDNCFSCEERSWGFGELNKIDPGTLSVDIPDITFNNTWIIPSV